MCFATSNLRIFEGEVASQTSLQEKTEEGIPQQDIWADLLSLDQNCSQRSTSPTHRGRKGEGKEEGERGLCVWLGMCVVLSFRGLDNSVSSSNALYNYYSKNIALDFGNR